MRISLQIFVVFLLFLDYSIAREEIKTLQIGIKKRISDCTKKSIKGDLLHVHYKGKLADGTVFDSSYHRNEPFTFTLGTGQVIQGWDQGLMGMCAGEVRNLIIPPYLAYGERGIPPTIPSSATLTFDVEIIKIERREDL